MAQLPHCLFLDSAMRHPTLGRYSFLTADPFDFVLVGQPTESISSVDPIAILARRLKPFAAERVDGLPPFQGGAAGLFGYELGRSLERLPPPRYDEFGCPALAVGLYDVVAAVDHVEGRAWIISHGFPEVDFRRRERRAAERLEQVRCLITQSPSVAKHEYWGATGGRGFVRKLVPQFPTRIAAGATSNFSRDGYLRAVERVIDYIRAGDVFQVNLSQRLLAPARDGPADLYWRLRRRNPAPFAGYFDLGEFQVVSASPERFLRVSDREVETRPIKGTRPRTGRPEVDRAAEAELIASDKDRAENVMIVDLLRNDLSRNCTADSVRVEQLCAVERYEHVLHLVSSIAGHLRDDRSPLDLLRGAFPGGSITGAPKVRAMEIIAELEPTARGPYCGSLGYLGFDGSMDLSILIRTITAGRGWWQFPVGGGVVAQSSPEAEYEETWHKAEGMVQAL
ncbi:MAG: aminodeoxychorismate synthase component I [Pirellulales bacterium]|nr:aminodeoxychorismate synthase component I [Pirellulales bacterium]